MSIQSEKVQRYLDMRQLMTSPDLVKNYTNRCFDLALEDKEAATLFLSIPNRLIESIPRSIEESKLMDFARKHPELINKLVEYGQFSSELTSKLCLHAVNHLLVVKNPEDGTEAVSKLTTTLFELAILDKNAATLLLSKRNRFTLMLPLVLPKESIAKLAKVHPELFEQLVEFSGLSPDTVSEIQKLIRGAGRTRLAIDFNRNLQQKDGVDGVYYNDKFVPMITRKTADFSYNDLCSVGSETSREIIILEPQLPEYTEMYERLSRQIPVGTSVRDILNIVKSETRKYFPKEELGDLVSTKLAEGSITIPLLEFIAGKCGVCRHHTLLNCFFLSRLLKDGLLTGYVIQHRQDLDLQNAHTWAIFCNRSDGKIYSFDSLWNFVINVTDNPGELDRVYSASLKVPMQIEAEIKRMHFEEGPPAPYNRKFALAFYKPAAPVQGGEPSQEEHQDSPAI